MKIIIFDLDQTLIDLTSIHDKTVERLFYEFFGIKARLTEIDFGGRSLTEIFRALGRLKGLNEGLLNRKIPAMIARYEQIFAEAIPSTIEQYILPGVKDILTTLKGGGYFVVMYTGDSPGIIGSVLKKAELDKYFDLSFSGTEVEKRSDMIRKAMLQAERVTGHKIHGKDVVVIGDSPRDVEAGKELNTVTIAVATGFYSQEVLKESNPDFIFKDLSDNMTIMSAITSGNQRTHNR